MTRIPSIVTLLVSLTFTLTNGYPTQGPHEVASKGPSPERTIRLMGQEVKVPPPSFRLFNVDIHPQKPSNHAQPPPTTHTHHQQQVVEASSEPPPIFRLFGVNHDRATLPRHTTTNKEAVESHASPAEKGASPPRGPATPPPPSSSPSSGEGGHQRQASASRKGKDVVVDKAAGPDLFPIDYASRVKALSKGKGVAQPPQRKTRFIHNADRVISINEAWAAPTTKKRTKPGPDTQRKKTRMLSTIIEEEPSVPAPPQKAAVSAAATTTTAATHNHEASGGDDTDLLAQHKFRVIDPVAKKAVPFNRELHGTHHELGHKDNLYHYLENADKLVKNGEMNEDERVQTEHNLKKSVKAIGSMMSKKPGTAIHHEGRNVIFQNPGPHPHDEAETERQVKKALRGYQEDRLRRLVVKNDKLLSFKKPKKDRTDNRLAPAATIDYMKMVDPVQADMMQKHNERVAIERPGYHKTWHDESSSESEGWMSSPSNSE